MKDRNRKDRNPKEIRNSKTQKNSADRFRLRFWGLFAPSALVFRWLPDMDLNHDKQIQSLLCYRYTIGQTSALRVRSRLGESRTLTPCRGRRKGTPITIFCHRDQSLLSPTATTIR